MSNSHLESKLAVPNFLEAKSGDCIYFPSSTPGDGERIIETIAIRLFELLTARCYWNTNYY